MKIYRTRLSYEKTKGFGDYKEIMNLSDYDIEVIIENRDENNFLKIVVTGTIGPILKFEITSYLAEQLTKTKNQIIVEYIKIDCNNIVHEIKYKVILTDPKNNLTIRMG